MRSDTLWGLAWLLGALSAAAWIYLMNHHGGVSPWDSRGFLALGIATTSAGFSAACMVLVGVRASEARVLRELKASRVDLSQQ
jgi:hypothetical protein